jgi:hypothetical protein
MMHMWRRPRGIKDLGKSWVTLELNSNKKI